MHSRYNRLKANALSERGKRMAAARWANDRARRDAEMPERLAEMREIEMNNLPRKQGDILGTLQWSCARTGKVRRWVIRIGERCDRITVEAPREKPSASHGWSWFLAKLRKHLYTS
jgi:hypothetical protein